MKVIWLELILEKGKVSKSHEPNWSSTRYKVVGIRGNQYMIPIINKQKLFLRREILVCVCFILNIGQDLPCP